MQWGAKVCLQLDTTNMPIETKDFYGNTKKAAVTAFSTLMRKNSQEEGKLSTILNSPNENLYSFTTTIQSINI